MNWSTSKISDVCEVGDGAHASIKRQESGIRYLTSKNFKTDGLDLSKVDYISLEDFQKHFKEKSKAITKPKKNDILLSIIGSIGSSHLVNEDEEFGLSSSVSILRPAAENIDPKYLLYWTRSSDFQGEIFRIKSGVAQSFLSLGMIKGLTIAYPNNIIIQQRIASILSAYDDLIENNLKRIKLLEEAAQNIYKEWFVNFRFPNHEKTKFVEGLPEGWVKKNLYDIVNIKMGFPFKGDQFNEDKIGEPVIRIRDIPNQWSNTFSSQEISEEYWVERGDILIGMDGFFYLDVWGGQRGYLVQRVCRLRSIDPLLHGYILQALKAPITYFEKTISGATVAHLGAKHLKEIEILIPSRMFDDQFILFNSINKQKLNLLLQNQTLKESRDILLPRLMNRTIEV